MKSAQTGNLMPLDQSRKIIFNPVTNNQFFVSEGKRRHIPNGAAKQNVLDQFEGIPVEEVDWNKITEYQPAAQVPRKWSLGDWIEPPQDKQMMREIIVSRLKGRGIEYGAGSRPNRVPLDVQVEYAEPFQSEEQYERMKYNENTVVPKFSNPIEDQYEFENDCLDFIVAAHVIEHTPNPIKAIVESYRTLKKGGHLVLIVPDKRHTFDRPRDITTLQHLITDYEDYKRERDLEHYYDFFIKVKRTKNPKEDAEQFYRDGKDTHFHVWDPASFHELLSHIQKIYAPFSHFEIKPRVDDKTCIEFYAVLTK
jgi:SAM-dependent methyltransferase